jgi:hypothetical protein
MKIHSSLLREYKGRGMINYYHEWWEKGRKAITDAFIKGGCSEKSVGRFVLYKMEQFIYKCK